MSFISFEFLLLFVSTFILYYRVKYTYRKYILLFASFVFIGFGHLGFLLTALLISLGAYAFGLWIDSSAGDKGRKRRYITGIMSLILCWLAFRYNNYIADLFLCLLEKNREGIPPVESWIFPLGISFYTFQSISYLTEIYWQEEKPEKDLPAFMLYLLFFMKFLSGPIERPADMLPQIHSDNKAEYRNLVRGMELMTIGLIKKLMIAGYMAPYIDNIFSSIHAVSGIQLLMACLLYPIELYADFSGYTDMALGGACLFGLKLTPNFNRPFVALTTTDFWRRWHISLSLWIRDYIYLPLSVSLRRFGKNGVFISLIVTFVSMGIWHGAGWHFIIYGIIQGVVICYEVKSCTFREKLREWLGNPLFMTISIIRTYLIFALSLVFFRLESVSDAIYYIKNISFGVHTSWKEMNIGMPDHNCIVAGSALFLIFVYEYSMSKRNLPEILERQPVYIRWGIYSLMAVALFALGQFSSDNFIYLQF